MRNLWSKRITSMCVCLNAWFSCTSQYLGACDLPSFYWSLKDISSFPDAPHPRFCLPAAPYALGCIQQSLSKQCFVTVSFWDALEGPVRFGRQLSPPLLKRNFCLFIWKTYILLAYVFEWLSKALLLPQEGGFPSASLRDSMSVFQH